MHRPDAACRRRRSATAIAVLPLENLSPGGGQEFLSAGLHDALITTLSRITRFGVTSRFSSRRITEGLAFPEIGELLSVDKILFGSVMRDGDQIRVNVTHRRCRDRGVTVDRQLYT